MATFLKVVTSLNEANMIVEVDNKSIEINPFSMQVELTGRCNLKCRHCRGEALAKEDVSLELFKKYISFANIHKEFNMILSGGEPLLNKSLPDILEYLDTLPVNEVVLTTNGTLINDEHIACFKKIKNYKLTVQVSIDSFDEAEHNLIRGSDMAFKNAIRGIQLLVKNNIFTSIRATITPKQFNDMESIILNAYKLGAKRVGLSTIVPVGRATKLNKDLFFEREKKKEFIDAFLKLKEKYKEIIEVVTHEPQKNCYTVPKEGADYSWYFGGCTAGIGQFNMESNGNITPCALLNIPITNIKEKDIPSAQKEYVSSEIIKRLLLKDYEGNCKSCNHKHFCGGCRAIPYNLHNNPFGEDVSCFM